MDTVLLECAALGLDIVLFGVFYKLYRTKSENIKSLKNAACLEIDSELPNKVKAVGDSVPYAAVTGTVKAMSTSLRSQYVQHIRGVIREKVTKERKVKWSPMLRLWSTVEHDIQRTHNCVPFSLYGGAGLFKTHIEVLEPLTAEELIVPTVYDEFTMYQNSVGEAVVGWFRGERITGIQEIESMLSEGEILTCIGELVVENEKLRIRPPKEGLTYFLTSLSLDSLLKKLSDEAHIFKVLSILMGAVSTLFMSYLIRKGFSAFKKRLQYARQQRLLEEARNQRRMNDPTRGQNANEIPQPLCVICLSNPIEVLILECGHACLCLDCSQQVHDLCPVCRAPIERVVPAYLP